MINVKIITPNGLLLEKKADSLSIPTKRGRMQIFERHSPSIILLDQGNLQLDDESIELEGGILSVSEDEVLILSRKTRRGRLTKI